MHARNFSGWNVFFALLGLGGARLLGAATAPSDPVVELPPVTVTDNRELPPPESWHYAVMPGFEILSNASDRKTQQLLSDFALFRQALSIAWPLPTPPDALPTTLILCGKGGKFDAFLPAGRTNPDMGRASFFLTDNEVSTIVMDLQASTLHVTQADGEDDPASGTDTSQLVIEHDKQLYREYIHLLLSRSGARPPAWFEEGLTQLILAMKFEQHLVVFGKLEDPNAISAAAAAVAATNAAVLADDPDAIPMAGAPAEDRDFNAALQHRALVPMDQFFAIGHDSPEALNPLGNNRWAKQAYAFVHMCLYGQGGHYQQAFATFLQRSAKEPVTEALFKECFGMTYKKMLLELRGYIDFAAYEHKEYIVKGAGLQAPPPLELREATQAEIGRIKGEAFRLGGHGDAARTALIAPYIRGELDPQLLAALGLSEHAAGRDDRAQKFLESAVAAKVARPRAYVELSRLRRAQIKPAGPEAKLTAEETARVMAPLIAGAQIPPPTAEIYRQMGDVWAQSAVTPAPQDLAQLQNGVVLFPGDLKLVYQAAVFYAEAGQTRETKALVDHALKISADPAMRARFQQVLTLLPASARAP